MEAKEKSGRASVTGLADRLANLSSGRDEMNLCELPFATLSERNTGRDMLQFQVHDFDHQFGRRIERSLTVKGDAEFGLPTEKDEEIYIGLLKYTSDYNGFASPEVSFSRSTLFELMGWPKTDWAYARLTKGMHRLVGVRLSYQNLWRDNSDKQWRDQGAFGILDSFNFRDSRAVSASGGFTEQTSIFRWGSVLFKSFDSGYLKRIDYGLARGLSPAARRLYRYLDKHFHPPKKTRITIDLSRLAYQHVGVSPGVTLDKARKRHIAPAAEELERAGYLRPVTEERFSKVRRGVWNACFELAQSSSATATRNADKPNLVKSLQRRGVSTQKALGITAGFDAATITGALRAMDEQVQNGTVIRSADRWIDKALRQGFRASPSTEKSALRPERRLFRSNR